MTIEQIFILPDGTYETTKDVNGDVVLGNTIDKSEGYWVSDDTGVTIHGHLTRKEVSDALNLMDVKAGEIIGVWTDEGITYLDRSFFFYGLNNAIDFGNLYNQKAIWDCAKGEEIRL